MEILSPAGNFEALKAAVQYGADAVYVGGSRYSARSSAANFTDAELSEAVDYCHIRGVRLYVCVNTLLLESELSEAMRFVRYAYQIGVDALIIQDLGLMRRIRQELPDFPLHASTQMTVVNHQGVETLAEQGLSRVVLAREVTKEGIASIRRHTDTELEYFVHGALCISYSGQCLMSSLLGGRSGNRGACAQPCRLPYTLLKNGKPVTDNMPLLCPKDLCLADKVQELAELGVSSLKIEGRMKSPDYVAMVTAIYKRALTEHVSDADIQDMLKFFSRGGSCHGYYDGCTYGDMMDTKGSPKIAGTLPQLQTMERTVPVSMELSAKVDEPLALTMRLSDGRFVSVMGEPCQKAHTRATDAARMEEQLAKLGGTAFCSKDISVETDGETAVSVSCLNELRRQGVAQLEQLLTEPYKRTLPTLTSAPRELMRHAGTIELCAEVQTEEQLRAAMELGIRRMYMPRSLFAKAEGAKEKVLLLPPLSKEGQSIDMGDAEAVCIQNIGQLSACRGKQITAGHRLNVANSESAEFLFSQGAERVVLSPELNVKSIMQLRQETKGKLEIIGYGHLPLMLLENCIVKSAYRCDCDGASFSLLDRKQETFPLQTTHCGTVVYNGKPIYMADRMEELKKLHIDSIRLSFSFENYETCCNIIRKYQKALAGGQGAPFGGAFTRGHFYRGMQ
ncbi:MAG: U32 family peptidase [Ruminococcaceae bacterium]|nr:U32 family peptidase [Oscillospiraceae bacterium]